MEKRKQVLVITNSLTEEEVLQIKHICPSDQNQQMNIKLNLVHVIPYLPVCYFTIPSMGLLIERFYNEAKESLQQVGRHLGVPKKDQWLISGKIRTESLRLANKLHSSFILAGSQQIKELQRSLFFKNIHQYALIRNISQLEQLE